MGSIRNVLYGYSVEKGVIVLNREEAPIVFEAFNRYCDGEILRDIADSFTERKIAYYRDKTAWTKNIICRMIENRNYVGNDKYPPIISDEIYTIANQKKQEKGSQKTVLPPITEHIKSIMLCECCGSRFRRINKWRRREKWQCTGGCKCDTYLEDKLIFQSVLSIINRVTENPDLLDRSATETMIPVSPEITKKTNDIYRMIDQGTEFGAVVKLVTECAESKYSCCQDAVNPALTKVLKDYIMQQGVQSQIELDFLRKAVKRITISMDGTIKIHFANDAEVSNQSMKGEIGNGWKYGYPNNYENRSESGIVQQDGR